ncbi:MAG: class I SAM-dependent methyltransferase [Candidatus Binataceae bacterium]
MASERPKFLRVGPVHFQPLEWELENARSFIRGAAINAGCGFRDITSLLCDMGAASVVNADLWLPKSGLAVSCNLELLPFANEQFDTVLCNAVLEHVASLEGVMKELVRVLRPGGHMVLSIPFLQPYHAAPRDFRRFTREGMMRLGEQFALETIAIYPVHTIAQTLGWILWEYLLERGNPILKAVFWPMIWAATRYSCRSDISCFRSANTFQGVYTKAR